MKLNEDMNVCIMIQYYIYNNRILYGMFIDDKPVGHSTKTEEDSYQSKVKTVINNDNRQKYSI